MNTMRSVALLAVAVLAQQAHAAQELNVWPTPGNFVGVAFADQDGRWLVRADGKTVASVKGVVGDKQACMFQGPAGAYMVLFVPHDINSDLEAWDIVLGEGVTPPKPNPPDPPVPPEPPDPPDVPDGLWGLTKMAYAEAVKLPSSQKRAIDAVSRNYQSVAARIVAGALRTPDEAKAAHKAGNREAIPEADRPLWADWNQAVVAILIAHDAELIANMTKIADAYNAIAKGLELTKE